MRFTPLGDAAITVELDPAADDVGDRVRTLVQALATAMPAGVVDIVPACTTVTVFYDPSRLDDETLREEIARRASAPALAGDADARLVEIPVCYDPDFAPDLPLVADRAGLDEDGVIARHSGAPYQVRAVGFSPGFPYLGGLPERLHTPRLATPRTVVPAGSVGIGGAQTGVYPFSSPGGWNLIGRTPLALFDPASTPPALLRAGDRVRFKAITREEFESWR